MRFGRLFGAIETRADDDAGESGPSQLATQADVLARGQDWHRTVLTDVEARLGGDTDFPCLFSKGAFRKGLLLFSFVEGASGTDLRRLAQALTDYVELSRGWDGSLGSAHPLVVAFSLTVIAGRSQDEYHDFGWEVLHRLHEIDPAPWPDRTSRDVNDPSWSMCFNGMQIFCNMSHPAHRRRRSRNLGDHFLLVINPRERFDIVAGDNPAGRKVRAQIRRRIALFDAVPHAPDLGSYGGGSLEWKQYGLDDGDGLPEAPCPFHARFDA